MQAHTAVVSSPSAVWRRALAVAAGAAFVAALVQSIDAQWLIALGVPAFVATFLAEAIRNWWKQHRV